MNILKTALAAALLACAATVAQAAPIDFVITYNNAASIDAFGDADNVRSSDFLAANAHIIGIGWDVEIRSIAPSWRSESSLEFSNSSTGFVTLTPGTFDLVPGAEFYSSGGVSDLVGLGLDFFLLGDGLLLTELFEIDNDTNNIPEAFWNGEVTVRYELADAVPEPGTLGLFMAGLAGIAATARRRRRTA